MYLEARPLYIIERIDDTSDVSPMAHLIRSRVMLEVRAVDVVVVGVAINKPIQHNRVEWKAPVLWRRSVSVTTPFSRVLLKSCQYNSDHTYQHQRCLPLAKVHIDFRSDSSPAVPAHTGRHEHKI